MLDRIVTSTRQAQGCQKNVILAAPPRDKKSLISLMCYLTVHFTGRVLAVRTSRAKEQYVIDKRIVFDVINLIFCFYMEWRPQIPRF